MRRISVAEIMQETGLSRATIDRVLNGRGRVHARTLAVVQATMQRLSAPEAVAAVAAPRADIALRVGRGMMAQMRHAAAAAGVQGAFEDLHMADDDSVVARVEALCKDAATPLIITAKNSDRLVAVLRAARARGKRIVAAVSDLATEARDCFVSIDNRAAGQTAAFLIGSALGDRPTTVGFVLGDIAFRCHEDREIGFRTGLRAHFPRVILSGEAQGEDSSDLTRDAVLRMLKAHPAMGAIYNAGGGNAGLIEALRVAGRTADILVVGHEVNTATVPLLRSGGMDYAISGNPTALLAEALRCAALPGGQVIGEVARMDFGVYTRFNLPNFGTV